MVPFAAGGPVDTLARLISLDMQTRLNTDMVIEDKGGAGGVLATEQVARAPADGKTLLFTSSGAHVVSAALRAGQVSYDPVKSFVPIAFAGAVPMLVIVSPDYPVKTLAELIAKAKTDKLSYASAGAGSTMHIIGEMINAEAGIKTTHVPYKGVAPALNDLLGGHIQFLSADLPVLEPLVKSGKVRALAIFAAQRSPLLPDVPTSAELGYPGLLMNNWYGMLAPAGLPAEMQATLEKAMLEAMKSPMVAQRLASGGVAGGTGGKEFAERLDTGNRLLGTGAQEARHQRRVGIALAGPSARLYFLLGCCRFLTIPSTGWDPMRFSAAFWVGLLTAGMAFLSGAAPSVAADSRVALVIGNSIYQHANRLPNPANDALAVANLLKKSGFDVDSRHDLPDRVR